MQLHALPVGGMIRLLLGLPIEQGSDQADGGAEVANEEKQAHGEDRRQKHNTAWTGLGKACHGPLRS
jgi:hypothetical protein